MLLHGTNIDPGATWKAMVTESHKKKHPVHVDYKVVGIKKGSLAIETIPKQWHLVWLLAMPTWEMDANRWCCWCTAALQQQYRQNMLTTCLEINTTPSCFCFSHGFSNYCNSSSTSISKTKLAFIHQILSSPASLNSSPFSRELFPVLHNLSIHNSSTTVLLSASNFNLRTFNKTLPQTHQMK